MSGVDDFSWDDFDSQGVEIGSEPIEDTNKDDAGDKKKVPVTKTEVENDDIDPSTISDEDFMNTDDPDDSGSDDSSSDDSTNTDDDDPTDTTVENTDDSEVKATLKSLVGDLKLAGIIPTEVEDKEYTSEEFLDIFEKQKEADLQAEIAAFAESFDEEGKAFIEFKKNGGSTVDFLKLYMDQVDLPVESIDSPEKQEEILRYYLKTVEEMTIDEINEELDVIKERNQLEKRATKVFKKINDSIEVERQASLDRQAAIAKDRQENREKFITKLNTTLETVDSIKDIPLSTTDKKKLVGYIVNPTVNIEGKKVTPVQAKISEIYSDPEKLLLFTKMIMSDFDFSVIAKKKETEATKKALSVVSSRKKSPVKKNGNMLLAELMKNNK